VIVNGDVTGPLPRRDRFNDRDMLPTKPWLTYGAAISSPTSARLQNWQKLGEIEAVMSSVLARLPSQIGRAPAAALARSLRAAPNTPCGLRSAATTLHWRTFRSSPLNTRNEYDEKAKELNQKGLDEHEQQVRVRQHQVKRPWHRDGADKPPVTEDGEKTEPKTKGECEYDSKGPATGGRSVGMDPRVLT